MDVVLASVVVTPGPGMIMFSLEALLEPPRKPFTEQAEKFVKLEELDGCGKKTTRYQGVQSRAPLFSVSLQNVLHSSWQDSDSNTRAATYLKCIGKLQTAHVQLADQQGAHAQVRHQEFSLKQVFGKTLETQSFIVHIPMTKEIDMKDEGDYNCHVS